MLTDPGLAAFNHAVFDGAEPDVGALLDAVKSPPMMSEYKLVEWRYADFEKMKESTRDALDRLLEQKDDYPYTVLVFLVTGEGFDPGTAKRPSKLAQRYGKLLSLVNFEKSTDAQLLSWLKKHFDAEHIAVDRPMLDALLLRVGHSMDALHAECEKLICFAKARGLSALDADIVGEVTASTVECDTFALSNAITGANREVAFTALADMKARRVDPILALGMMAKTYSELVAVSLLLDEGRGASDIEKTLKINPYKIKIYISAAKRLGSAKLARALSALSDADAAAKSGGAVGYGVIERFVAAYL